ncbi:hypothetical protein IWZ01DRAFT_87267 [Phyllosticta capitalensis]
MAECALQTLASAIHLSELGVLSQGTFWDMAVVAAPVSRPIPHMDHAPATQATDRASAPTRRPKGSSSIKPAQALPAVTPAPAPSRPPDREPAMPAWHLSMLTTRPELFLHGTRRHLSSFSPASQRCARADVAVRARAKRRSPPFLDSTLRRAIDRPGASRRAEMDDFLADR